MSPHDPILIRAGRLIDPASGTDEKTDLAIENGRIAEIGPDLPTASRHVIDATGHIVCPGLIDPHVHLRDPGQTHKEDILSGSRAAVAGGFTTVCCMPNTAPAIDTPEIVNLIHTRARDAECRVHVVAAATKDRAGQQLAEIHLCREAGAVAFSDDGDAIAAAGMMDAVLRTVRSTGTCFMQHCQDPTLTHGADMHAGAVQARLGLGAWPPVAEELIIERDIRLNRSIGCRYHVQHISAAGSVELVRQARADGMPVTAEASPHHLLLTHEACDGYNTNAKMNPPLREQADIDAIRQGVADGTISVLATDHAPHSPQEKAAPFAEAPFGIIGLETALALYAKALIDTNTIDWPRLIALMTIEPARLCGLDALNLARLEPGAPADVTIIDPTLGWTITEADLTGKSRNTPFLGTAVTGRATTTIVGGRIAFQLQTA